MTAFSSLPLSPDMLANLNALGYTTMTDIQAASIAPILKGRDVLAQAKTGSGKTAAFGIGVLENIDTERYRIQALVLCPTRELATQVTEELRRVARFKHNLKLLTLTGGMPMHRQELSLKHQAHIVVGTPGRVLKLLERKSLVLQNLSMVVLDEADRMLDMGFIDQLTSIFSFVPKKRQTLCFSATFPPDIRALGRSILNRPTEISVDTHHEAGVIEQYFYSISIEDRAQAVITLLAMHKPTSCLIFCNTKDAVRSLTHELKSTGLHCLALHGDLEQKERTETLIRFSNASSRVLVATDVAARGLDIEALGAVINYDLPFETETYLHRVGRTGRAGSTGLACSLLSAGEAFRLDDINVKMKGNFTTQPLALSPRGAEPELTPLMVTLSINGGRKNKISAGDILGALTSTKGLVGSDVGKIDRLDHLTFVAIKRERAKKALDLLQTAPIKGRRFLARMHN